jgi:hypothetical protein
MSLWGGDKRPLRVVSRAEFAAFVASDCDVWGCYDFACHNNPAYREIDWDHFSDAGYQKLTPTQRTLNNLNIANDQILNGGLVQLFFNWVEHIEHFVSAINTLGWPELTRRFEEKYAEAFIQPGNAGSLDSLNNRFQKDVRERPWAEAAKSFTAAYDHFDFMDFDSWYYEDETTAELVRQIKRMMRERTDDLFSFKD